MYLKFTKNSQDHFRSKLHFRKDFHYNEALEAELQAMAEGLKLAAEHSSATILIQSDCAVALKALSDDSLERSTYGQLVSDIKYYMNGRIVIPVKIVREQNRVTELHADVNSVDMDKLRGGKAGISKPKKGYKVKLEETNTKSHKNLPHRLLTAYLPPSSLPPHHLPLIPLLLLLVLPIPHCIPLFLSGSLPPAC